MHVNVLCSMCKYCLCVLSFAQDVQLVGGSSHNEGTVEVSLDHGVTWRTTCGPNLALNDAIAVCKHLNFTGANRSLQNSPFQTNADPTVTLTCGPSNDRYLYICNFFIVSTIPISVQSSPLTK